MRRYLLTPRWLMLHVLVIVLVATFLGLGWWQWRRGEAGNARSFAYAIEWPLFAVFTVFMWARLIRDDARSRAAGGQRTVAGGATTVPSTSAPPVADGKDAPGRLPRVAAMRAHRRPEPDDEVDEELAAYNRYLAQLNAETEHGR